MTAEQLSGVNIYNIKHCVKSVACAAVIIRQTLCGRRLKLI